MYYLKHCLFSILLSTCLLLRAQPIEGKIFELADNADTIPLPDVNVYWLSSLRGTTTDSTGRFYLPRQEGDTNLVVSHVGYIGDTIYISDVQYLYIRMNKASILTEVLIKAKQESAIHTLTTPINRVTLSEKELQKAACCNLSESFETEGSVDVMYRDGVTGAKEIQMLGLSGTYTQLLRENIPTLRGLATTFGLNYVPGPWLESIQISKGAGSVVNGYESMTGQINLEFKKPFPNEPPFFLNIYGNHLGRIEGNIALSKRFNEKVGGLLLLHGSNVTPRIDFNNDSFLDIPRSTQINLYNRWETSLSQRVEMQTGINLLGEDRIGGQINYDPHQSVFLQNAYGVELRTIRADVFHKIGLIIHPERSQSIGLIVQGTHHNQNGFYGRRHYRGKQNTFYLNVIPQTQLGNEQHKLKTGLSFLHDNVGETFDNIHLQRTEIVPGAFAEYHFDHKARMSLLAGFRLDYHNLFGWQFTPRLHYRYNFTENSVFRLSGGRGFRVPNLFAENTNVLVSSRNMLIQEKIMPEVSWNWGVGLLHNFYISERKLMLGVEFYRTQFLQQLIVDLDHHLSDAIFYNLDGKSYGNSFQVDLTFEITENLFLKATYKLNDVHTTYGGRLLPRLMIPRHNGLINAAYSTRNEKWLLDLTVNVTGKARLAHNAYTEAGKELSLFSPIYTVFNMQITRKWKIIDWYLGGENLTHFRQLQPIVDAHRPFDPTFDASMIWGPIVGVIAYTGVRLTIR